MRLPLRATVTLLFLIIVRARNPVRLLTGPVHKAGLLGDAAVLAAAFGVTSILCNTLVLIEHIAISLHRFCAAFEESSEVLQIARKRSSVGRVYCVWMCFVCKGSTAVHNSNSVILRVAGSASGTFTKCLRDWHHIRSWLSSLKRWMHASTVI